METGEVKNNSYQYSPLKELTVRDFRCVGNIKISFEHSPIVCLLGENEAGKTSVIKAMAVCGVNAYASDQKDFIRTGQQRFMLGIALEDGTAVVRVKGEVENRYTIGYPDGTRWSTNKLPVGEGVPKQVDEIMGITCEPETKEMLNIRTYEDQLLFVVTPKSLNYKMMYNSMKVDSISRAIKIGSTQVNALRRELGNNETGIATLEYQVNNLRIIDIDSVVSLRNRVKRQIAVLDKLEKAVMLCDEVESAKNNLGYLRELQESGIQEISSVLADKLNQASGIRKLLSMMINSSSRYRELLNFEEIGTVLPMQLANICKDMEVIRRLHSGRAVYSGLDEFGEIDTNLLDRMRMVGRYSASIGQTRNQLNIIEGNLSDGADEISVDTFIKFGNTVKISKGMDILRHQAEILRDLPDEVDDMKVSLGNMARCCQINEEICAKREEHGLLADEISNIGEYFEGAGVAVETCPNCGETVIMNLEQIDFGG